MQTKELLEPIVESNALIEGYVMSPGFDNNIINELNLIAHNKGLYDGTNDTQYNNRDSLTLIAPANIIKLYTENILADNSDMLGLVDPYPNYDDVITEIIRARDNKYRLDGFKYLESGLQGYVENRYFAYKSTRYFHIGWEDYVSEIKSNRPLLICVNNKDGYPYYHVGVSSVEKTSGGRYMGLYSGWKPTIIYLNCKSSAFYHIDAFAVTINRKSYNI